MDLGSCERLRIIIEDDFHLVFEVGFVSRSEIAVEIGEDYYTRVAKLFDEKFDELVELVEYFGASVLVVVLRCLECN